MYLLTPTQKQVGVGGGTAYPHHFARHLFVKYIVKNKVIVLEDKIQHTISIVSLSKEVGHHCHSMGM